MTILDERAPAIDADSLNRLLATQPTPTPSNGGLLLPLRDYLSAADARGFEALWRGLDRGAATVQTGTRVSAVAVGLGVLLLALGVGTGLWPLTVIAGLPLLLGVLVAAVSLWAVRARRAAVGRMAEQSGWRLRAALAAHLRETYDLIVNPHMLPEFPGLRRLQLITYRDTDVRIGVSFADLDSPVEVSVFGAVL